MTTVTGFSVPSADAVESYNRVTAEPQTMELWVLWPPPPDEIVWTSTFVTNPVYTRNEPVESEAKVVNGGFSVPSSFYQDVYDNYHIVPSQFNLGNLLSSQQDTFEVWNSYTTPQQLTAINATGDEGILLSGQPSPPSTFAPLESRVYTIDVNIQGPSVIDAEFDFVFTNGIPVLAITGNRIVTIGFIPQRKFKERIMWLTDVLKAKAGEQRISLRGVPRRELEFSYFLDALKFSRFKAQVHGWASARYGIPDWYNRQYVGAISSGTTVIPVDTTYLMSDVGEQLIVWESDTAFESYTISAVDPGVSITIDTALANSYTNAFVMPLRIASLREGLRTNRDRANLPISTLKYLLIENKDHTADIGLDQYKSTDVLTDRWIKVSAFNENIVWPKDILDSMSGQFYEHPRFDDPDNKFIISWQVTQPSDTWRIKNWLYSLRGKQKAFYVPTWNNDLQLIADMNIGNTTIEITSINYPLYYGQMDMMILFKDGTIDYNTITSSSSLGGSDFLNLESSFAYDLLVADVDMICLMHKVRLDSDSIEFAYEDAGLVSVSVPVMEIPA